MSAYKDITSMVMCPDVSENTNASLRIDNLLFIMGWTGPCRIRRFAEHENVDNLPRLRIPLSRWMSVAIMDASATKGETRPRIQ